MLSNNEVRKKAKEQGVRLWEVAEVLNISEPTMTRKLRKELPTAEKERILSIIEDIASGRNTAVVSA
ncbi:MAG: hypothetical protein MSH11_00060 [Ruminococcus sp.]|nr:hypothetical protein [Ruminococcus sp.]